MNKKRLIVDAIALKPCPFCGAELVGKEEIWRNPNTGITKQNMVYSHPKNNCVLDYHRFHFYAHPWKIDQWNNRVEIDPFKDVKNHE